MRLNALEQERFAGWAALHGQWHKKFTGCELVQFLIGTGYSKAGRCVLGQRFRNIAQSGGGMFPNDLFHGLDISARARLERILRAMFMSGIVPFDLSCPRTPVDVYETKNN